jgi:phosphoketolase
VGFAADLRHLDLAQAAEAEARNLIARHSRQQLCLLFEGNGVTPDVVVPTQTTDLIGVTDSTLSKAIELLR